jgi:hypothetical protein
MRKRYRDSALGRFVTAATARANPTTTEAEKVSDLPAKIGALKWEVDNLKVVMRQVASDLRYDARHAAGPNEANKLTALAVRLEAALKDGPR